MPMVVRGQYTDHLAHEIACVTMLQPVRLENDGDSVSLRRIPRSEVSTRYCGYLDIGSRSRQSLARFVLEMVQWSEVARL